MNPRAIRPVLAGRVLTATGLTAIALAAGGALLAACGMSATPPAAPPATVTTTVPASPSAPASQPGSGSASTAPAAATSSGTAAAPGCLTRYLHGTIADTNGGAGSIYSVIVFKNLSNVSCTLYGFPGVAVSRGLPIKLVGATAAEDSTSRELVTLPPHGYAHANLRMTALADFPDRCRNRVTVHWLQVIPPNQVAPLYLPFQPTFRIQACQDSSNRTMTVSAVRPGKGP
jgi:hypothetical protein